MKNFCFIYNKAQTFTSSGFVFPQKSCIFAENFLVMAKIQIKSETRQDLSFFPLSFDDYVPKDDKVRIVDSIVRSMDSKLLLSTYDGIGAPPYSPMMLLSLVIYSYINGVYSCRGIASRLRYDVRYMWICGGQRQSFSTINRFRSNHLLKCIDFYFDSVVAILVEKGVITLEEQYVDGTKIESKANRYTFVWKKTVQKNREKLLEKTKTAIGQIKEEIKQLSGREDGDEEECTLENSRDIDSKARLCESLLQNIPDTAVSKRERNKLATRINRLHDNGNKMREYESSLKILGNRNSYSKTDKDATFMRLKEDAMNNGQTKPAYNLQIATENQYFTNFDLYSNPTDTLTFKPFLKKFTWRHGRQSKTVTADSGYGSLENYEFIEEENMVGYVKYNMFHKEQHKPFKQDAFNQANRYYNKEENYLVCPMGQHMEECGQRQTKSDSGYISVISLYKAKRCDGCPLASMCKTSKGDRVIGINHRLNSYKKEALDLLTSEEGLKHRSKRPIEPEAVFGQTKFDMGYKRFRHFGMDKVYMDFGIFAMSANLKKLLRIKRYEM